MEAKNIKSVIDNLKKEKEVALLALNKVREELDFGEDLLKLRGDKIQLLQELTALRLEVENLEKSKKKDFLFSIRGEISEFEAKKRSLSLEVNELISAIASFKAEKILLNKTLDEISQRIVKDEAVSKDAIKTAFQDIEAQEARILKRNAEITKKEAEVKEGKRRNRNRANAMEATEEDNRVTASCLRERSKELEEGEAFALEKIEAKVKALNEDDIEYAAKVVKKETEFSVWEDNLKLKTQELKEKFSEVDTFLKDIEKDKTLIKKEKEDLKISWEEYTRQNNILKKRCK